MCFKKIDVIQINNFFMNFLFSLGNVEESSMFEIILCVSRCLKLLLINIFLFYKLNEGEAFA